jgi:hypothetical protein
MLKKNLLFLVSLIMGIAMFTGCNDLDGESYDTLISPAFISYYPQTVNTAMGAIPFLCTPYGEFAVPELALRVDDGDCLYAQFTITETQSSQAYTTATNVEYDNVRQLPIISLGSDVQMVKLYEYPLSNIIKSCGLSTSPLYQGRLFVLMNFKEEVQKQIDYRLFYNPEEITDENSTVNMCLEATLTEEKLKTPIIGDIHAFNLDYLFHSVAAKDTTITANSLTIALKRVIVNLQYSSLDGEGNSTFTNAAQVPTTIYIYKN